MKKFFVIGKVPGYNKVINKQIPYEDKLLPHLTFVDLIPRTVKFNKGALKDPKTFVNNVLTYAEADHPMKYFNKVMEKHIQYLDSYNPAAKYDGIRFIATVDSAINNGIIHNYDENLLDRALDSAFKHIVNAIGKNVKQVIEKIADVTAILDMLSGKQYDDERTWADVSGYLNSFKGYRIHMPKMWVNTSVQDILQLSIKLTSPSGDPKSIKRYIIEPLIIIFIMSSPLSITGTDLGMPFIYEVDAHGMGHYKLAGITSINFDRGGTDVDFNIYQQPLTVNVRLTLMPLATDALTALKDTSFYKDAWFQTPDTIARSLEPKKDIAEVVTKIYNKRF